MEGSRISPEWTHWFASQITVKVLSFLALGWSCYWMLKSFLISQKVKGSIKKITLDMFRSLMVRQIRIDMKMMGQTERKRKEGGQEGRTKKSNQQQISVIVPDCSYCHYFHRKYKYRCTYKCKVYIYYVFLLIANYLTILAENQIIWW